MPTAPRPRALLFAVLATALVGVLGACSEGTHPEFFAQRYVIEVDSLAVPGALAAGDTIEALFWGYVGPNSCHVFEGFEEELSENRIDLRLWTKYFRRTGYGCREELVYLEGESYTIGPLPAGAFTLVVHQPDGTAIEQVVTVSE
jgi:hypothetical protein